MSKTPRSPIPSKKSSLPLLTNFNHDSQKKVAFLGRGNLESIKKHSFEKFIHRSSGPAQNHPNSSLLSSGRRGEASQEKSSDQKLRLKFFTSFKSLNPDLKPEVLLTPKQQELTDRYDYYPGRAHKVISLQTGGQYLPFGRAKKSPRSSGPSKPGSQQSLHRSSFYFRQANR